MRSMRSILRQIYFGHVRQVEVDELSGRVLAPEDVDLVAEATVGEVDRRRRAVLEHHLHRHDRAKRAALRLRLRRGRSDQLRDLTAIGMRGAAISEAEVAGVARDVAAERNEVRELEALEIDLRD